MTLTDVCSTRVSNEQLERVPEGSRQARQERDCDPVVLAALDRLHSALEDRPLELPAGFVQLRREHLDLVAVRSRPAFDALALEVRRDEGLLAITDSGDPCISDPRHAASLVQSYIETAELAVSRGEGEE